MIENKLLQRWLALDPGSEEELSKLEGDQKAIEDRFGSELSFGTAGLRGIMEAGFNRMNYVTVARASQGFANYLKKKREATGGRLQIVVAYDSRKNSKEFAETVASVFASNGFISYIFDKESPVPLLSYAIRQLDAIGGVMITASHNPPEYNGYKVYGADGCQLLPDECEIISELIRSERRRGDHLPFSSGIEVGIIKYVPFAMDDKYLELAREASIRPELFADNLVKTVYTPLHGVGGRFFQRLCESVGCRNIMYVDSQMEPDGDFPTVKSPNPESESAYAEAKKVMRRSAGDLAIANDPDADRMGVMLKNGKLLTGNQMAALFLDYILSAKKERGELTKDSYVVSSVVSGELPKLVAKSYGVRYIEVLTGFKYIGRVIDEDPDNFIMGFEESLGYLFTPEIRDKDGITAALLATEIAIYRNKNLDHALRQLHRQHGTYIDLTESIECSDAAAVTEGIRRLAGNYLDLRVTDYLNDDTGLPKENLIKFEAGGSGRVMFRPSGTEPKLKIYYSATGDLQKDADACLKRQKEFVASVRQKAEELMGLK